MNGAPYAIALDVGGTSIKSGVVAVHTPLIEQRRVTPVNSKGTAESILSTIAGVIRLHVQETASRPLLGIALAFPGPFDYDTGVCLIKGVEKYESLFDINVSDELRNRLDIDDCPIRFRNDAEAAIVGECLYGAGREYSRVIGLTLGTGLGSAFVVHGIPQKFGKGVPPNGWLYSFPVGDVQADDYFSARGLVRKLREMGGLPVDPEAAAVMARRGDATAGHIFSTYGAELGSFLTPFIVDFHAEVIVVLGGIAQSFDLFGPSLCKVVPVPVFSGTKGTDAASFGAAQLLMEYSSDQ